MKRIINQSPRKQRKSETTPDRALVFGALQALNKTLTDLRLLTRSSNTADSIVEIGKLLLMAEMIAKIIKALT
jgi:hypothetical protein